MRGDSNKLIATAVNKKYPEALNPGATLLTEAAVKAALDEEAAQMGRVTNVPCLGRAGTGM
jgi:hypothetical protein